ncbi:PKD domain-containing protein [Phycicoccus jejuensis]|uniref:PKD domain-containing protein n=1 Tax=Phycicoccus jejuensis TaxID=367299 RepID=UPI0004C37E3D|nr:hypothetical protein [Phycicoccus jejuensis]
MAGTAWVARVYGEATMVAGVAWVSRVYGEATQQPTAYVAGILGSNAVKPYAMVAEVRGEATVAATALIAAIRGEYDAAANSPTATAGQGLTVQPGSAMRLAGTGAAKGAATVASYAWRVVSRSATAGAVALSNPAARNPRVRFPVTRKASWYVFGLTVTDSLGRTSPEATVRIDVRQAQLLAASAGGWRPVGIDVLTEPGADVLR